MSEIPLSPPEERLQNRFLCIVHKGKARNQELLPDPTVITSSWEILFTKKLDKKYTKQNSKIAAEKPSADLTNPREMGKKL